uniref:BTB domain-containing protein n=1 Tax=Aegilops tauschii subsp. strangulata TaxID=200361 RepID=A0A453RED9_AEGTS
MKWKVCHALAKFASVRSCSPRRFILLGQSLPREDRLPSALRRVLQKCLANSREEEFKKTLANEICRNWKDDDLADLTVKVDDTVFRCHQVILASRSEYFKTRLSRTVDFLEGNNRVHASLGLPFLEEHDLSTEAFEKMLEYM